MENRSVLIVDDDAQICETLQKLFTDTGYSAHTALTYAEGIASINELKPSIAVVDLALDQHTGIDFVREARSTSTHPPVFVILTNSFNAQNVADAMDANITMFIQKADHDPAEIVRMITHHYGSSTAQTPNGTKAAASL